MILQILLWLILSTYLIFVAAIYWGWKKLLPLPDSPAKFVRATVIVAVRNEAENLENLLNDLHDQQQVDLEITLIDDHSTDETRRIFDAFLLKTPNFRAKMIRNEGQGKKSAISCGVEKAETEIILTTDADCRLPALWAFSLLSCQLNSTADMVLAPVRQIGHTPLGRMASVEFMSLNVSTGGACYYNRPIMANAANMLFTKKLYKKSRNNLHKKQVSGDDVFLLHAAKRLNSRIVFAKDSNALITTTSPNNVPEFLNQRKRWASKSTAYRDMDTILVASLIWFLSLSLIIAAFTNTAAFVIALLIKSVADYQLLKQANNFYLIQLCAHEFLILSILYPFYIILASLGGWLGHYSWK